MKISTLKQLSKALLPAVLLCITLSVKAQTIKPAAPAVSKGASAIIETFFKKYKTSPDSAVDYLFSTNKWINNPAQINMLKSKLDSLDFNLGRYLGKELIGQKSATPSLVIYSYLVKHETQPIRFIFMFYKPENDWEIYRFNFDDGMDVEMLDAVKIKK